MKIKIKNISIEYDNQSIEPIAVKVDYSLVLNDSQLEGTINIKNGDMNNGIYNCQLWEYNRYIHQKIMASL